MNYKQMRSTLEKMANESNENFTKALISFEKGINDKEALDKLYTTYMENDSMALLNDEFDYMIDELRENGQLKESDSIEKENNDIVAQNMSTYVFGWYYTNGNKYQDMAKSFGDRLVYPFVTEIDEYIKDIATDMGFDDENKYNININSTGVQVNIADHGGAIHAEQENSLNTEELKNAITCVSNIIEKIDNLELKSILEQNLDTMGM